MTSSEYHSTCNLHELKAILNNLVSATILGPLQFGPLFQGFYNENQLQYVNTKKIALHNLRRTMR